MANVPTIRVKTKDGGKEVVINATDFNEDTYSKIEGDKPQTAPLPPSGPQELFPPRVSESGVVQALENPVNHDPDGPEPSDRIRLREATPDPLLPSANPPTAGVAAVRTDPSRDPAPAGAGLVSSTSTGAKPSEPPASQAEVVAVREATQKPAAAVTPVAKPAEANKAVATPEANKPGEVEKPVVK